MTSPWGLPDYSPPHPRLAWWVLSSDGARPPARGRRGRGPTTRPGAAPPPPGWGGGYRPAGGGAPPAGGATHPVISSGLGLTSAVAVVASVVSGLGPLFISLLLCGAASASVIAASGRVVVGWFPPRRRGLAMGIRQTAQPLGVAVAAVTVPVLSERGGVPAALLPFAAAAALLSIACAFWLKNPAVTIPERPQKAPARFGPYRSDRFLVRIHLASILLVIPQIALSTFGVLWFITAFGWSPVAAGFIVAVAQLVGAIGRALVGHASDAMGSRVRILRWIALCGVLVLLMLIPADVAGLAGLAAISFVIASAISVADNGIATIAVAEAAGSGWTGRSVGIQNTGQYAAAAAVAPAFGYVIANYGYPISFIILAATPLLAFPLIPQRDKFDLG